MSEYKKTALVLGAGGFIGSHMVKRLRSEGYWVRGVDLKRPDFSESEANEFITGDLRDLKFTASCLQFKGENGNFYHLIPNQYIESFDEIYQFAADMGGAGFIFTGENDADIMHNSATINLNVLECQRKRNELDGMNKTKIFILVLLACIQSTINLTLTILTAVKNQHIQQTQIRNMDGRNSLVRDSTSHTIVIMVSLFVLLGITIFLDLKELGTVEERKRQLQSAVKSLNSRRMVDLSKCGEMAQTRSFLFIDECIEATRRLMDSEFIGPVNIGSEEMVTINQLVETAARVGNKEVSKNHKLDAPLGVRGRNSNNDLIREKLGWDYSQTLEEGIRKTYNWIQEQIKKQENG